MSEARVSGVIQQLDAWQLLSDDEQSPSQSPLPQVDSKLFLKYELEMQISALRKSSLSQEPTLVSELNELQIRKAALKMQRKTALQGFNLVQERTKKQLRTSEENVKKLADQLAAMEARHSARPKELQESETFNSLKVALKPLEDATRAIDAEKRRLQALCDQQEGSLFPLSEGLQMLREEYLSRAAEIEMTQVHREFLSRKLAEMRKGHETECDKFFEEFKAKESLAQLLARKAELSTRVAAIQQRLAEVTLQEEQTEEQLNSMTPHTPLFSDVSRMERMLSEKCQITLKMPFNQLIGEISKDHSYNIEMCILKEQVVQMEKQSFRLIDQWKVQRDQDQAHLESLHPGSAQYVTLRNQMQNRRQHQSSYTAMIEAWKKQVKSALEESRNAPTPITDDIYRSEVQKRFIRLLPDPDKEDTQLLFDKYLEALQSPQVNEGRTPTHHQNSELATLTEIHQSLQFSKASLESEKTELQKELFTISGQEKNLRAICEPGEGTSPTAFKKILSDGYSKEEYSLLVKTFGKQALAKMTQSPPPVKPRSGLQSKFDEIFKSLQNCDSHVETHKKTIETLLKLCNETKDLQNAYQESYFRTKSQIEAIIEAEEELINRTEAITETKLREIRVSIGRNRYMKDTKMTELTNQVYKTHEKAGELRGKLTEMEKKHEMEMKNIEKETEEVKSKKKAVKKELEKIKGLKTQLAGLEKQLRDLEGMEPETEGLRRTRSCIDLEMEFETGNRPEQTREKHVAKTYIFSEAEPGLPDFKLDLTSGFQFDQVRPSNLGDFTLIEADFFRAIQPLLDGGHFFKKFSQKSSLISQEFDPLEADVLPPEKCGYGMREVKLNKALTKLEVRQPNKPGIESSIMLDKMLDPIVPQHTMAILKTQKSAWLSGQQPPEDEELKRKYPEFKRMGIMDFQSPIFEAKCMDCVHYVFFIVLERGGRVELVADSYVLFKRWVEGLKALVRCRKLLPKLKFKLT